MPFVQAQVTFRLTLPFLFIDTPAQTNMLGVTFRKQLQIKKIFGW